MNQLPVVKEDLTNTKFPKQGNTKQRRKPMAKEKMIPKTPAPKGKGGGKGKGGKKGC